MSPPNLATFAASKPIRLLEHLQPPTAMNDSTLDENAGHVYDGIQEFDNPLPGLVDPPVLGNDLLLGASTSSSI